MMESRFADIDGIRLNYGEGEPNGPALVFLSGFPGAWNDYALVYELLEPHYRVFAPTLQGMGLSERSDAYSIAQWIDSTARFIVEVVGKPALGVGHSAGAWFGLAAAAAEPGLFSAFVSLDQPLDPLAHIQYHAGRSEGVKAMATAMREAIDVDDLRSRLAELPAPTGGTWGDQLSDEELAAQAAELSAHDPEIFAAWVNDDLESWIVIPELQAWPGAYRNPVLFLDGDPDAGSLVSREAAEYNLERYPWAERVEMAGLSHGLGLYSEPGPVVAEIRRFFDGPPN